MTDESFQVVNMPAQREEGAERMLCCKTRLPDGCFVDDGYFTKNFSFEGENSGCHGDTMGELSSVTEIKDMLSSSFLSENFFRVWRCYDDPGGPELYTKSPEGSAVELQGWMEAEGQAVSLESHDEYKRDLKETIQLCEALMSEKTAIAAERDGLAQHLLRVQEENQALREEKEYLMKDIEEKREMEEFKTLEKESTRQYETELATEVSRLQRQSAESEAHVHNLESDLAAMSAELKRKEELITELQGLWNKDSAQEIRQLKRSLQDAEALSRDTRKEWALLRSEVQALRESEAAMTADHTKMEAEVKALRGMLKEEKRRFKEMEADLLKELQSTFQENARLNAVLGGEADKTVVDLKSLEQSQERERHLQAKVAELEQYQQRESKLQARVAELEQSQERERDLQARVAELEQYQETETHRQARIAELEQYQQRERDLQVRVNELEQFQERALQAKKSDLEQFQEMERALQATVDELEQTRKREMGLQARVSELEASQESQRVLEAKVNDLEDSQERESMVQAKHVQAEQSSSISVEQDVVIKQVKHVSPKPSPSVLQELSRKIGGSPQGCEQMEKLKTAERELEELRSCVTTFAQEREQLMEVLEGLREERSRLRRELHENQETVSLIQQQLSEQRRFYTEQQALCEKQQADLEQQGMKITELEEALITAEYYSSTHKEATHLLQTELQDLYAQLAERDRAMQALEHRLEEAQVGTGAGLLKKTDKVSKADLQRAVLSPRNQEEGGTVLDSKEVSRKLKEAHRTQKQSSQSPLVDTTKGYTIKSPAIMDTGAARQVKSTQPDIHVTSGQEAAKWRRRATQLKENRGEPDMLQSPHTPTGGRRIAASEGRIFDSPKSRFFDGHSDRVRLNCPRQFFDNSTLGTLYDLSPASEDKDSRVLPLSPRQDNNCNPQ